MESIFTSFSSTYLIIFLSSKKSLEILLNHIYFH